MQRAASPVNQSTTLAEAMAPTPTGASTAPVFSWAFSWVAALLLGALVVVVPACGNTPAGMTTNKDAGTGKPGPDMSMPAACAKCGSACCNGKCVDAMTDAKNCGACGKTCADMETCVGGTCQCNGMGHCAAAEVCCANSGCVDLMTDVKNCGTCGNTCNDGETCTGGQCGCGMAGNTCTAPQICCTNNCMDPTMDPMNCGACGTVCGMGETCMNSACSGMAGMMCGMTVCKPGEMCLGGLFCLPGGGGGGNCMPPCAMGQMCLLGMCLGGGGGGGCMPACVAPKKCQFGIICL